MASTIRKNVTRHVPSWLSQYDAGACENSDVIATTPVILMHVTATNKSAGTLYVLLFDSATVPANSTSPTTVPIAVPAGTTVSLSLNEIGAGYSGVQLVNGLSWAASSTASTLTVDSSSSVWVTARYAV